MLSKREAPQAQFSMTLDKMNNDELFDAITSCLDSSGGASLEELRAMRRALGHDVPASEKEFLAHLATLRDRLKPVHTLAKSSETTISSLLEQAGAIGIDAVALADQSGLSVSLVTKFDRRLIAFSSVPQKVIERLAVALRITVESLSGYLEQAPALAVGARFKAQHTPTLSGTQNFFDAVTADRSISEERRSELMQMKQAE